MYRNFEIKNVSELLPRFFDGITPLVNGNKITLKDRNIVLLKLSFNYEKDKTVNIDEINSGYITGNEVLSRFKEMFDSYIMKEIKIKYVTVFDNSNIFIKNGNLNQNYDLTYLSIASEQETLYGSFGFHNKNHKKEKRIWIKNKDLIYRDLITANNIELLFDRKYISDLFIDYFNSKNKEKRTELLTSYDIVEIIFQNDNDDNLDLTVSEYAKMILDKLKNGDRSYELYLFSEVFTKICTQIFPYERELFWKPN